MIKKIINYTDYDGNEREESFYFNLTESEIVEMEFSTTGGLTQMIEKIVETRDSTRIMSIFKEIILKSYGEKSADGRRFVKSSKISEEFSQTPAYNKLFMELVTDAKKASDFVNGLVQFNSSVVPNIAVTE